MNNTLPTIADLRDLAKGSSVENPKSLDYRTLRVVAVGFDTLEVYYKSDAEESDPSPLFESEQYDEIIHFLNTFIEP